MARQALRKKLPVVVDRSAPVSLHPFTRYFKGFEKVEAVRAIFGNDTERVLGEVKVEFYSSKWGYMSVSDQDGHILISTFHLKNADPEIIYLDIIHELHHVKQFHQGRSLFDRRFEYPDSPTEIEAYIPTVQEAKRIGMSEADIVDYLRVEWMTPAQHRRLVKNVGLGRQQKRKIPRRGS